MPIYERQPQPDDFETPKINKGIRPDGLGDKSPWQPKKDPYYSHVLLKLGY